jgi:hypothetical protein
VTGDLLVVPGIGSHGAIVHKANSPLQALNVWALAGTMKTAARKKAITAGKKIAIFLCIVKIPRHLKGNWAEDPRELMLSTALVASAFTLSLVSFANLREHRGGIVCGMAGSRLTANLCG